MGSCAPSNVTWFARRSPRGRVRVGGPKARSAHGQECSPMRARGRLDHARAQLTSGAGGTTGSEALVLRAVGCQSLGGDVFGDDVERGRQGPGQAVVGDDIAWLLFILHVQERVLHADQVRPTALRVPACRGGFATRRGLAFLLSVAGLSLRRQLHFACVIDVLRSADDGMIGLRLGLPELGEAEANHRVHAAEVLALSLPSLHLLVRLVLLILAALPLDAAAALAPGPPTSAGGLLG
mmetsp:Transcript_647/g.1441  ORF Transcript_647/g.1441 Transcript_647/m.1441 type:complete len:238 (-) Transcript_647:122-835(-)